MIKIKDIIKHELIGLRARIVYSKNRDNINLKGKIINETKHTITIKTRKGNKMLFKNNIKLELDVNKKKVLVDGGLLAGRPEDRVKK